MEMEGSGGSQSQLTHPAMDVDEAALGVTKRERKRSRYLSPPYTETGVEEKKAAGSQKQREEEEEGPPHVSASEVLAALQAAALGQGEGMDAASRRFLAMYIRNRKSIFVDDSHAAGAAGEDDGGDKPRSAAAGVGRKMLSLNAGLDDGSLAKKKKKKTNPNPKNPHLPPAAAVPEHANGASHSAGFAVAAAHGHPNPPVVTTVTLPTHHYEKKRKMNKKMRMKTAGQQHRYVGNPVALVLDLAEGTPLPSREDLLSTFSKFGFVIDSETTIIRDKHKHTARVTFATRAQAEAALSCSATLGGAFGPPSAVARLQDLPPITPLPKLPLTDIRNNLGKMILSLSSKVIAEAAANAKTTAVDSLSLVGEMQRLLAKVDKVLQVQGASATAHHA